MHVLYTPFVGHEGYKSAEARIEHGEARFLLYLAHGAFLGAFAVLELPSDANPLVAVFVVLLLSAVQDQIALVFLDVAECRQSRGAWFHDVHFPSQRRPDGLDELRILRIGKELPLRVHREDAAPLEFVVRILRNEVEMQMMPRVAVRAVVHLCRLEHGVQRLCDAVHVREERVALLVGQRGNLTDVQLGGDDHTSTMALFLEKIELRRGKLDDLDSKHGEVLALGAIAAGFHFLGIRHAAFICFHVEHYIKIGALRALVVHV